MDELLKCKNLFEFISFLPNVLENPIIKNYSGVGRIEVMTDSIFLVVYYDDDAIMHIHKGFRLAAC